MGGRRDLQTTVLGGCGPVRARATETSAAGDQTVRRFVPLAELSPVFDEMYGAGGRPSIPPERLLKASLIISVYSVRSERVFCEELDYHRHAASEGLAFTELANGFATCEDPALARRVQRNTHSIFSLVRSWACAPARNLCSDHGQNGTAADRAPGLNFNCVSWPTWLCRHVNECDSQACGGEGNPARSEESGCCLWPRKRSQRWGSSYRGHTISRT
jgi:hypothetical protein